MKAETKQIVEFIDSDENSLCSDNERELNQIEKDEGDDFKQPLRPKTPEVKTNAIHTSINGNKRNSYDASMKKSDQPEEQEGDQDELISQLLDENRALKKKLKVRNIHLARIGK